MSIKETYKHLKDLLTNITADLDKAENGNKAASQRVRTGTVRLEKLAKQYRKESISFEKKNKGQKKTTKSAASAKGGKTAAKSSKPAASKGKTTSASKAKTTAKPKAKSTSFRPRQLSVKRATAKLPTRRVSAR